MRVKNLFKAARSAAPCVIFIDEFDSLGNRDAFSFGGAAEAENRKIINKVLTELDGFGPNSGVIVIAATNNGASLDKALVREGRFDRRCALGLPNLSERKAILEHYASKLKTAPEVDFSALARRSAGMTPAALSAVVNKAGILALKRGKTMVGQEEFNEGMTETQLGSPSAEMRRLMAPETRERVALHEAGHALAAFRLGAGVVEGVTILPRSRALGLTLLTQEEGQNQLMTSRDLLNHVCVLLGGREAERLVYGDPSSGARDDLEKASGIALAMVSQFGMGNGPTYPLNLDALPPAARQMETGKLIPEAAAVLRQCEKRTSALLQEDLPLLLALRSALLERETLDRQEVEAILAGGPGDSPRQPGAATG
jgi:cell division protease FtsH